MAALRGGDPAIKLFGRTIPLLHAPEPPAAEVITSLANDVKNSDGIPCVTSNHLSVEATPFCSKNSENGLQATSRLEGRMGTGSKTEEIKTELELDGSDQDKVLKKPDKILPCPRCNSMETKFCYFNNYNVNQPRHFCRNCKRYWTAGGAMRNVPVGAGRRRNKHASQYRNAMMPCDNTVAAPRDAPGVIHHQALPLGPPVPPEIVKENETDTKFGSEVLLCKSTTSVTDIGEQKNTDLLSLASGDDKEEKSSASSSAVSGCSENRMPDNAVKKEPNNTSAYCNGVTLSHPCAQPYPTGPVLVFPWSPGWNNVAVMAATQCSTEPVNVLENGKPCPPSWPYPGTCAPAVPFPLALPFWGCFPGWPNGVWSSPWPGSNGTAMPSAPPNKVTCSGNSSPSLGKHPREENLEEENTEKNLWVPKTLRIDDPAEAAKSSIWATLGIKPDDEGISKPFQSKVLKDGKSPESPQFLQANPAAFSRSQSFQERT